MPIYKVWQRRAGVHGQSTVEFALLVIPLFLFVIGVFDLGRAVYQFHLLSNAAREAARFGVGGRAPEEICQVAARKTFARDALPVGCASGVAGGGLWAASAGALTVEIVSGTMGDASAPLEVRLAYPFRLVTPLISTITGETLTLRAASTMYREFALPTPNPLTPSPTPNRTPTTGPTATVTPTPTIAASPTVTPTPTTSPTATTPPTTVNYVWDFTPNAEGWAGSAGNSSAVTWNGSGEPTTGSLEARIAGRNKTDTNVWSVDRTWQQLGVPAGKTVTGVQLVSVRQRTSEFVAGGANSWSVELRNTSGAQQVVLLPSQSETQPDLSWSGDLSGGTQGVPLTLRPSTTTVRLAIVARMATANAAMAAVAMRWDHVTLAITYV